jgi:hypothetical protein
MTGSTDLDKNRGQVLARLGERLELLEQVVANLLRGLDSGGSACTEGAIDLDEAVQSLLNRGRLVQGNDTLMSQRGYDCSTSRNSRHCRQTWSA